ncbi:MAG: response regulator [Verrucomicrobiae bacterium]|nr:response regulator [Verrucomicrobiae bacterium]
MPADVIGSAPRSAASGADHPGHSHPQALLRDRVRRAAEDSLGACLPTLWIVLAVVYAAFTAAHLWFLPEPIRRYLALLATATSLAFALAATLSRRRPLAHQWITPLGGLTALILWFNSSVHLGLTGQPHDTTNLIVVLIGTAMVLLNRPWFFIIASLSAAAWIAAALIHSDRELWAHFGFALFSSATLAVVMLYARLRDLERIEGLRSLDARHQAKLELALQDTRHQLASIWQNSRDGMAITDATGHILSVNHAAAAAIGLDESQLAGKPWYSVLHPAPEPGAAAQAYARLLAQPTAAPADECEISLPEGRRLWVSLSHLALPQSDGPPHLLTLIRNVTRRRQIEEERRTLERRMDEAQRLESLGVLAGGIAHDFNNLLTVILGSLDLIRTETTSPPVLALVDRARTATQHAASLCSQMLAYAGRGRIVVLDADLNTAVRETVSLVTPSTPKSIRFHLDLAHALPALRADISQLRQVLMNLALNAIEALGSQPGLIRWTTRLATPPDFTNLSQPPPPSPSGEFLCLEVTDNGCGMDSSTLARIFDPFFTTKFTGRGLGLAAVQGMVRSHSGALCVTSQPGVGSTFRLLFPALPSATPTVPQVSPAPQAPSPNHPPPSPPTILVVDDEPFIRELIALQLRRMRCRVLDAPEGQAALNLLRHHPDPIHLVLLDLTMPGMDGAQTLRELRQLPDPPPVILMSGYTADEIQGRFAQDGLAGYLHKPFASDDLAAQIRRALPCLS